MLTRVALAVLLGVLPLLAGAWLLMRVRRGGEPSLGAALAMGVAGAVLGGAAAWIERSVLGLASISEATSVSARLAATLVFVTPLEEGLKVAVVWPLYSSRRLATAASGAAGALCAAAGFTAATNVLAVLASTPDWLPPLRLALATPAALIAAAAWGTALGAGRSARGRWFAPAWLLATALRGFYDHIVHDRGPAALFAALPLLVAMATAAWIGLREIAPLSTSPSSRRPSLLSRVPEPPSLGAMRRALRRSDRPVMLGWIGIGALVTVGVMITLLGAAVWIGHRLGIDFAAADESDLRSGGPLALLGLAVLAAFPFAGFLVARASGSDSVLEPALAAALALALVVTMLSVAAPVAVVFALAVAPVAFGLACGGAWFGLGR